MQAKSIIGAIGLGVAVLYCGGLATHLFDVGGSVDETAANGLGPTVLGLGALGLGFALWLIVKLMRMSGGPPSPGSHGRFLTGPQDGESSFDADTVIARYLANQPAPGAAPSPAPPPPRAGAAAKPTGFGRREADPQRLA